MLRRRVLLSLLLYVAVIKCQDVSQNRFNPCPDVYDYVWDEEEGWHGVVTVVPPRNLSQINLVTTTSLVFFRRKAGVGRLTLDGEDENVSAKALLGERQELRFNLYFPPYKDLPRIMSININGKEFCPNAPEYTDSVSKIVSKYSIVTGVNSTVDNGTDFLTISDEMDLALASDIGLSAGDNPALTPPRGPSYQCGKVSKAPVAFITHGTSAEKGEWPWHVAIFKTEKRQFQYICGGSLIGLKAVVTAAHCVTGIRDERPVAPNTMAIYFGKHKLKDRGGDVQVGRIKDIIVHPSYNAASYFSDVAIVTLKAPVTYNEFVRPVCLWSQQWADLNQVVGRLGTVVGWGYNERNRVSHDLMSARMPVVSLETCLASDREYYSRFSAPTTFCAGYRNGTSACAGDSGGGLVFPARQHDNTELWFLRGLVSTGRRDNNQDLPCDPHDFVVFTDLAKFLTFLLPYIRG